MDELMEQAEQIAILIRSPKIDHEQAVAAVQQLVRAAYSGGLVAATAHTSGIMMRAFDAVTSANRK